MHLGLTTLEERIRYDLIETFKIMTEREAVDRDQFFQLSACEYNLRGHSMKFSFSHLVLQDWNKLPQEVIECYTSVNQFKIYNTWQYPTLAPSGG